MSRWAGRPLLPALFQALGDFLMVLFMIRAGVLAVARGGIQWRGTRYPLDELRRGRRFKL